MKNTHQCLKFFTAQSGPNDCGIACMAMILNYNGRRMEANRVMRQTVAPEKGLSLLEIRQLAQWAGLNSRCVRVDLANLREVDTPCILHVGKPEGGDHFVVCFGSRIKKGTHQYLIADPAIGVQAMAENDLVNIWAGNAALYFESLPVDLMGQYKPLWTYMFKLPGFRNALLFTVPLLNICSTLMGIGLSWMLQRGSEHLFADQPLSLLAALLALLFIITIFKNIINFVRRHLLIMLTSSIGEHLNGKYTNALFFGKLSVTARNAESIRNALADIRKIQIAAATFISVLASDSLMLTSIIAASFYYDPLVGIINIVYTLISLAIANVLVPQTIFEGVKLQQLAADYERKLIIACPINDDTESDMRTPHYSFGKLASYHNYARHVETRMSRETLQYELIGTFFVITIFSWGIYKLQVHQTAYNHLIAEVILSYFTVMLVPKICYALAVVMDGALSVSRFLDE